MKKVSEEKESMASWGNGCDTIALAINNQGRTGSQYAGNLRK